MLFIIKMMLRGSFFFVSSRKRVWIFFSSSAASSTQSLLIFCHPWHLSDAFLLMKKRKIDGAFTDFNECSWLGRRRWRANFFKFLTFSVFLFFQKADLAICDLTITYERRTAVDFTMPFMTLGKWIIFREIVIISLKLEHECWHFSVEFSPTFPLLLKSFRISSTWPFWALFESYSVKIIVWGWKCSKISSSFISLSYDKLNWIWEKFVGASWDDWNYLQKENLKLWKVHTSSFFTSKRLKKLIEKIHM